MVLHFHALARRSNQRAAVDSLDLLRVEFQQHRAIDRLADRFLDWLTLLARQRFADRSGALADQASSLEQDRRALVGRCVAPGREPSLGCFEGAIEVGDGSVWHAADRLAGGGIDHGVALATTARERFAGDQ